MNTLKCLTIIGALVMVSTAIAGDQAKSCIPCSTPGKKVYVQAGASSGNGTLSHPYGSLAAAAADPRWKTLIVLYSPRALDGGIALRPGTALIGQGKLMPILTNTQLNSNDGNAVTVQSGEVCIQNIHFDQTQASAIRYDNANNLRVNNVLVTGHNQALVTITFDPSLGLSLLASGILGLNNNNGSTDICDVVIKDNYTGPGLIEKAFGNATRKLVVDHCEFANLGNHAIPTTPGLETEGSGLVAAAFDQNTNYNVRITRSSFHDPAANVGNSGFVGALILSTNAKNMSAKMDSNSFVNLFNAANAYALGIKGVAVTENIATVALADRAGVNLSVTNNKFDEQLANRLHQDFAINWFVIDSVGKLDVNNNEFANLFDFLDALQQGQTNETSFIANNSGTSSDGFWSTATANTFFTTSPIINIVENDILKNNNYIGGDTFGAIQIEPNIDGLSSPWSKLAITLEGNCLMSPTGTGVGLFSLDFGSGGAGNATVNAHYNNITNYASSIADGSSVFHLPGANVNYNAEQNWWGPSGPVNIINLGTGTIDVSHPLAAPIKCLKSH